MSTTRPAWAMAIAALMFACHAASQAQAQLPIGAGGGIELGKEFGDALRDAFRSRQGALRPEQIPDLSRGRQGGNRPESWLTPPQQPPGRVPQLFPVDPGLHTHPPQSAPPMHPPFGPLPSSPPLQGLPTLDTLGGGFIPIEPGFHDDFTPGSVPIGPPSTFPPAGGLPSHDIFGP